MQVRRKMRRKKNSKQYSNGNERAFCQSKFIQHKIITQVSYDPKQTLLYCNMKRITVVRYDCTKYNIYLNKNNND